MIDFNWIDEDEPVHGFWSSHSYLWLRQLGGVSVHIWCREAGLSECLGLCDDSTSCTKDHYQRPAGGGFTGYVACNNKVRRDAEGGEVWHTNDFPDLTGVGAEPIRMRTNVATRSLVGTEQIADSMEGAHFAMETAIEAFETQNIESEFQLVPRVEGVSLFYELSESYAYWNPSFAAFAMKYPVSSVQSTPTGTQLLVPLSSKDEVCEILGGSTTAIIHQTEEGYTSELDVSGERYALRVVIGGYAFPMIFGDLSAVFKYLDYPFGNVEDPDQLYVPRLLRAGEDARQFSENTFAFALIDDREGR